MFLKKNLLKCLCLSARAFTFIYRGFFSGLVGLSLESWEVPFEEISDLQWVGSGAQGAVFLGKFHGEDVAVKKVRDIKETEIKHLRKLKHPNIITFK